MTLIKSISGIRGTIGGTIGDNLTPIDAVKFAAAYGTWLKNDRKKDVAEKAEKEQEVNSEQEQEATSPEEPAEETLAKAENIKKPDKFARIVLDYCLTIS